MLAAAFGALLVLVLMLALVPVGTGGLESRPDPADDYDTAVARVDAIIADEQGKVCDVCESRLLSHGEKTDRVVVLIHGLTNSPRQFVEMGEELYGQGYNVLILRMPYHGLKSLDVGELSKVKAEDLAQYADQVVDIAAGLGDNVTVVGLSGGGTVAGWIAQNREDVDRAVLIAPFYGIYPIPTLLDYMYINLFSRIPNYDFISSSEDKSDHIYQGESTRGVAQFLLLGRATRQLAAETAPAVPDIIVITNDNDRQVSNELTDGVADRWQGAGASVTRYRFDRSLDLPHDVIDLVNVRQHAAVTYPVIIGLVVNGEAQAAGPSQ